VPYGPDLWFSDQPRHQDEARRICHSCPVQHECLEYALLEHENHGIWGGESERSRRRIARQRRVGDREPARERAVLL
jgi:WhiB family redox-sensing transcriptional regulator